MSKTEFEGVCFETRNKNDLFRNSLMNLTAQLEAPATRTIGDSPYEGNVGKSESSESMYEITQINELSQISEIKDELIRD